MNAALLHPWRHRSKAESVSVPGFRLVPYWGGKGMAEARHRHEPEPRVVQVEGGWLALGSYLPWSHQTELIDRRRRIVRAVLPGDWPRSR